jgi:transcriptional regulator GlxA family with amidase domain
MPAMTATRRIVLLAYDQMNLLDLCGPLQALTTANRRAGKTRPYETVTASATGGLVTTSAGLPLLTVPVASLQDAPIDTLIVPGGCEGETYRAPAALVSWVAERAPAVRRLCSVCTGAFLLAAAGQLDGRRVTTHWDWVERLQAAYPTVRIEADRIFVRDGAVWTSAGVSAGIDLTLALIEDDLGHQAAIDVARQLVVFVKRPGGQSQFSAPLAEQARGNGDFAALHAWVAAHLHEDLSVERLAEHACMTPRTFARLYAARQGRTPARAVEAIRMEAACRALEQTGLPMKRIAANCGYREEQNLRRAFHRRFGITPAQYRLRFSAHATGREPA